jgi:hypothetical protein
MANTVIQLRHSTITGNVPSSLANGEISINNRDGKFFYSTPSGSIVTHYPYLGPSGLDSEIQFNDGGTIGASNKLTFNKTTGILTVNGGVTSNVFTDDGVDLFTHASRAFTQANSSFLQANTPSHVANSAASYANSAFVRANTAAVAANTPSHVANSAASYANSAFARANNSLDANNGGTVTGTITATSFITTGSYGNITGANTIYANNFVANTGFIQFADGSKQYTANGGTDGTDSWARGQANAAFIHANAAFDVANTGGGGGANSFGQIVANGGTILATSSNDSLQIVGESGITVSSNVSAKKVIVSVPAGFTFTTADYGFVTDSTNVIYDYGTL